MENNILKKISRQIVDKRVIIMIAFLAACVLRVNVIYIILACIALGVLRTVLAKNSP